MSSAEGVATVQLWQWIAHRAVAMLLIDLRAGRRPAAAARSAIAWSMLWAVVGAGFAGVVWLWAGRRRPAST